MLTKVIVAALFLASCVPIKKRHNGSELTAASTESTISFSRRFTGHNDTLYRIAICPTNRDLAISSDQSGHAVLWNLATGAKYWDTLVKQHKHLHAVAFSHDGRFVAVGGRSRVLKILSMETGEVIREFKNPDTAAPTVYFTAAFSPDDRFLLTSSSGEGGNGTFGLAYHVSERVEALQPMGHRLILWNAETGSIVHENRLDTPVLRKVDFSGDGRLIYAIDHATIRVFRDDGTPLTSVTAAQLDPVTPSPVFLGTEIAQDLRYAAVATLEGIVVLSLESSNVVLRIPLPPGELPQYLQFSSDRRKLLGLDEKSGLHIWSISTGERLYRVTERTGGEIFPFTEHIHPLISVAPDFSFMIQPYFGPSMQNSGFDLWKISIPQ